MTKLLAIDPGERTGWAYFYGDELARAGYGTKEEVLRFAEAIDLVVIERPMWYGRDNKVDVNDLIELAIFVGEVKHQYRRIARVELVMPVTWKGTVPKEIHNQRVLQTLRGFEPDKLPAKKDHNMLDAVGLGLWKLRRLG